MPEFEIPRLLDGLPSYIDSNVYCGNYPFRSLPASEPDGLDALVEEAGMEQAWVTPFEALFYNRSPEGLAPWLQDFAGSPQVRFWCVVNPLFPGWEDELEAASVSPQIVGARVFPRYHGYGAFHPELLRLLDACAARSLPVCLTARLLDDRLHPRLLRVDPPLDLEEVGGILKRFQKVRWVLSGFYMPELKALAPALLSTPEGVADIGICKPFEPWWDELSRMMPPERLILGTGAPLYYHAGTRLSLARSGIPAAAQELLYRGNALRLLERPSLSSQEPRS